MTNSNRKQRSAVIDLMNENVRLREALSAALTQLQFLQDKQAHGFMCTMGD